MARGVIWVNYVPRDMYSGVKSRRWTRVLEYWSNSPTHLRPSVTSRRQECEDLRQQESSLRGEQRAFRNFGTVCGGVGSLPRFHQPIAHVARLNRVDTDLNDKHQEGREGPDGRPCGWTQAEKSSIHARFSFLMSSALVAGGLLLCGTYRALRYGNDVITSAFLIGSAAVFAAGILALVW
jgi:hypothetical protein